MVPPPFSQSPKPLRHKQKKKETGAGTGQGRECRHRNALILAYGRVCRLHMKNREMEKSREKKENIARNRPVKPQCKKKKKEIQTTDSTREKEKKSRKRSRVELEWRLALMGPMELFFSSGDESRDGDFESWGRVGGTRWFGRRPASTHPAVAFFLLHCAEPNGKSVPARWTVARTFCDRVDEKGREGRKKKKKKEMRFRVSFSFFPQRRHRVHTSEQKGQVAKGGGGRIGGGFKTCRCTPVEPTRHPPRQRPRGP